MSGLLERVHQVLLAAQIPHALIGAAALAAQGIARSTFDVDLLTTDRRVLDAELWKGTVQEGVSVDIRTGDLDDPLGGLVRLEQPGERPVDIILGKLAWQTRAVERAEGPSVSGPAPVGVVDLILLKLYAGGAQDIWDVRELLTLPNADAIRAQVEAELQSQPDDMHRAWARVTGS